MFLFLVLHVDLLLVLMVLVMDQVFMLLIMLKLISFLFQVMLDMLVIEEVVDGLIDVIDVDEVIICIDFFHLDGCHSFSITCDIRPELVSGRPQFSLLFHFFL